jgi:hypothetical protein
MTHNPKGWYYSAIALINNSFLHLSDYGQRRECGEKDPDDQFMEKSLDIRIMGTSHEMNKISSAVSLLLLCTLFMVF